MKKTATEKWAEMKPNMAPIIKWAEMKVNIEPKEEK